MLILIYMTECDGDIAMEYFDDRDNLIDRIQKLRLHPLDYALVDGILLKSFNNKSFSI